MVDPLVLTKLTRTVIRGDRKYGRGFIATNKYKHCRTVKIYADGDMKSLEKKIDAVLHAAGSTNHSFNRTRTPKYRWMGGPAFIIRIPNSF